VNAPGPIDTDPVRGNDEVESAVETEEPNTMPTAGELARRAIEVAETLSPSMEAEMREATKCDGILRIPGRHRISTERGLVRRGLVEPRTTAVTSLGRLVRAVLIAGADTVLAAAKQRDADRVEAAGQTCARDGHEDRPAIAVLVYVGQGDHLGAAICRVCAICKAPGCGQLGDVMDAEYGEPWCQRHADQFGPDERVTGPDIVPVTSKRARLLLDK
jgi:hypothetical protein